MELFYGMISFDGGKNYIELLLPLKAWDVLKDYIVMGVMEVDLVYKV
jgi:hypothetical protein